MKEWCLKLMANIKIVSKESKSGGRPPWLTVLIKYVLAIVLVAALTAGIYTLHADAIANVSMVYLLAVAIAALFLGRLPAVFCSIISFFSLDYFFVDPKYQFTVQEPSEWLALCMFLFTATVIGQLTALLKQRAEEAQRSKLQAELLAQASWTIASDIDRDRAIKKLLSQLVVGTGIGNAAILVLADDRKWIEIGDSTLNRLQEAVEFVITSGTSIGWEGSRRQTSALPSILDSTSIYVPIVQENQILGVMYIEPGVNELITFAQKSVIESFMNHAAIVLQRDRLMKIESKAQALAEADKLKTALLSMVSHDFRSPLTSIKASVGSLLQEGHTVDSSMQKSLLEGVDHEADRLNKMVGNILDLSRLEADAWRPKREMTSIAELVGPVLDSFGDQDNERIVVDIDQQIGDVWIDSVQMVQVLRNLVENALKYSPTAEHVEMKVRVLNDGLEIDVLDHGPGLPKGEELRIFEPFYRAPGLRESSTPGVGIGLAVCKGLVEAHGGNLTAQNRADGGSIFRVSLPAVTEAKKVQVNESPSNR